MRRLVLAVSAFALAACSEQAAVAPVAEAPVADAPVVEPAADAGAVIPPAEVAARIAGTWTSIDDAKASIVVTADGLWTDRYADGETADAVWPWRAVTGAEAQAVTPDQTFTPEATYLEVKRDEGVYHYELGAVDAANLEMFYTGRGNRLAYTRAQ